MKKYVSWALASMLLAGCAHNANIKTPNVKEEIKAPRGSKSNVVGYLPHLSRTIA